MNGERFGNVESVAEMEREKIDSITGSYVSNHSSLSEFTSLLCEQTLTHRDLDDDSHGAGARATQFSMVQPLKTIEKHPLGTGKKRKAAYGIQW